MSGIGWLIVGLVEMCDRVCMFSAYHYYLDVSQGLQYFSYRWKLRMHIFYRLIQALEFELETGSLTVQSVIGPA